MCLPGTPSLWSSLSQVILPPAPPTCVQQAERHCQGRQRCPGPGNCHSARGWSPVGSVLSDRLCTGHHQLHHPGPLHRRCCPKCGDCVPHPRHQPRANLQRDCQGHAVRRCPEFHLRPRSVHDTQISVSGSGRLPAAGTICPPALQPSVLPLAPARPALSVCPACWLCCWACTLLLLPLGLHVAAAAPAHLPSRGAPACLCSKPSVDGQTTGQTTANVIVTAPAVGAPWALYRLSLCLAAKPNECKAVDCQPVTTPTTTCPLTGLAPNTAYLVTAVAVKPGGTTESQESDPDTFTTADVRQALCRTLPHCPHLLCLLPPFANCPLV